MFNNIWSSVCLCLEVSGLSWFEFSITIRLVFLAVLSDDWFSFSLCSAVLSDGRSSAGLCSAVLYLPYVH